MPVKATDTPVIHKLKHIRIGLSSHVQYFLHLFVGVEIAKTIACCLLYSLPTFHPQSIYKMHNLNRGITPHRIPHIIYFLLEEEEKFIRRTFLLERQKFILIVREFAVFPT